MCATVFVSTQLRKLTFAATAAGSIKIEACANVLYVKIADTQGRKRNRGWWWC